MDIIDAVDSLCRTTLGLRDAPPIPIRSSTLRITSEIASHCSKKYQASDRGVQDFADGVATFGNDAIILKSPLDWSRDASELRDIINRIPPGKRNAYSNKNVLLSYFKHLDLSGRKLLQLTENVSKFSNLEELHISRCKIPSVDFLPPRLKSLYCYSNSLEKLPRGSETLVFLGYGFNRVTSIPRSLSFQFPNLTSLDLSNNFLVDLSLLLSSLVQCEQLKHLVLQGNPCTLILGYSAVVIASLPSLQSLDNYLISREHKQSALDMMKHPLLQEYSIHRPTSRSSSGSSTSRNNQRISNDSIHRRPQTAVARTAFGATLSKPIQSPELFSNTPSAQFPITRLDQSMQRHLLGPYYTYRAASEIQRSSDTSSLERPDTAPQKGTRGSLRPGSASKGGSNARTSTTSAAKKKGSARAPASGLNTTKPSPVPVEPLSTLMDTTRSTASAFPQGSDSVLNSTLSTTQEPRMDSNCSLFEKINKDIRTLREGTSLTANHVQGPIVSMTLSQRSIDGLVTEGQMKDLLQMNPSWNPWNHPNLFDDDAIDSAAASNRATKATPSKKKSSDKASVSSSSRPSPALSSLSSSYSSVPEPTRPQSATRPKSAARSKSPSSTASATASAANTNTTAATTASPSLLASRSAARRASTQSQSLGSLRSKNSPTWSIRSTDTSKEAFDLSSSQMENSIADSIVSGDSSTASGEITQQSPPPPSLSASPSSPVPEIARQSILALWEAALHSPKRYLANAGPEDVQDSFTHSPSPPPAKTPQKATSVKHSSAPLVNPRVAELRKASGLLLSSNSAANDDLSSLLSNSQSSTVPSGENSPLPSPKQPPTPVSSPSFRIYPIFPPFFDPKKHTLTPAAKGYWSDPFHREYTLVFHYTEGIDSYVDVRETKKRSPLFMPAKIPSVKEAEEEECEEEEARASTSSPLEEARKFTTEGKKNTKATVEENLPTYQSFFLMDVTGPHAKAKNANIRSKRTPVIREIALPIGTIVDKGMVYPDETSTVICSKPCSYYSLFASLDSSIASQNAGAAGQSLDKPLPTSTGIQRGSGTKANERSSPAQAKSASTKPAPRLLGKQPSAAIIGDSASTGPQFPPDFRMLPISASPLRVDIPLTPQTFETLEKSVFTAYLVETIPGVPISGEPGTCFPPRILAVGKFPLGGLVVPTHYATPSVQATVTAFLQMIDLPAPLLFVAEMARRSIEKDSVARAAKIRELDAQPTSAITKQLRPSSARLSSSKPKSAVKLPSVSSVSSITANSSSKKENLGDDDNNRVSKLERLTKSEWTKMILPFLQEQVGIVRIEAAFTKLPNK